MNRTLFCLLLPLSLAGCGESTTGCEECDAGSVDAAIRDAAIRDAAIGDGGGGDAGTAGDAATTGGDAGGEEADGGAADGDAGACTGVHPVVGPPRTCERGSCLCVETDACHPVDEVVGCCPADGEIQCAPPVGMCMGEHPIVGPPRTCEPGMCFCANPDACFAPDRAAECCAVDVVCVPAS